MSPGMGIDKSILSVADLKAHAKTNGHWGPQDLVSALLKDGFSAKLKNPITERMETLCDLICFGSSEVSTYISIEIENFPTIILPFSDIISIKARSRITYQRNFYLNPTNAMPTFRSCRSDG